MPLRLRAASNDVSITMQGPEYTRIGNVDDVTVNGVSKVVNHIAALTVDNTIDSTSENPVMNKKVYEGLNEKVDKVEGKGLSTNDYDNTEKGKVATAVQPADISDMATKTWTNAQGFLKEHQSLVNYDTKAEVNAKDQAVKDWADGKFLTEHQSLSAYRTSVNQDIIDSAIRADIPTKTSQLTNDSGFLTEHQSLANYYTKSETNTEISNHHDSTKQNIIDSSHKLSSDLVDDTDHTNKFVTANEKTLIGTAIQPNDNVSELNNDAGYLTQHQSLANYSTTTQMNTAIANHHDSTKYDASNPSGYITSSAITGKENTSNKVTTISSASTNTQYPTAKCVYDIVGNIEAALDAIRGV